MSEDVLTCKTVVSVKEIEVLLHSKHNGFPVINAAGKVVGVIARDFLIILIRNKAFYKHKLSSHMSYVINAEEDRNLELLAEKEEKLLEKRK